MKVAETFASGKIGESGDELRVYHKWLPIPRDDGAIVVGRASNNGDG